MDTRILLIEDDAGLVVALSELLAGEGYRVEFAMDGCSGLARAGTGNYDLIVLDAMLPAKSGFDVCRDLRQKGFDGGILMLTAMSDVADRVTTLRIGVDDYVTKPFEPTELAARVEALLRRVKRLELLRYLVDNRDRVVTREEILRNVWQYTGDISSRTVDVHVAWLRQKLERNSHQPQVIQTVRSKGYRFSA
jgi:two-component system, OmpR family, alkaline phosphatase synthesis response regulator PhoP